VRITDNRFENIGGALLNLYRGGTDESTFGPHLNFSKNIVTNVGKGKRNKADALLRLHGVQMSEIENNSFTDSKGIVVEHTVGEPITRIATNQFRQSPLPEVKELVAEGPHTAILANNEVAQ
jgi:poly(beta-D-mannuronate) lyase